MRMLTEMSTMRTENLLLVDRFTCTVVVDIVIGIIVVIPWEVDVGTSQILDLPGTTLLRPPLTLAGGKVGDLDDGRVLVVHGSRSASTTWWVSDLKAVKEGLFSAAITARQVNVIRKPCYWTASKSKAFSGVRRSGGRRTEELLASDLGKCCGRLVEVDAGG